MVVSVTRAHRLHNCLTSKFSPSSGNAAEESTHQLLYEIAPHAIYRSHVFAPWMDLGQHHCERLMHVLNLVYDATPAEYELEAELHRYMTSMRLTSHSDIDISAHTY